MSHSRLVPSRNPSLPKDLHDLSVAIAALPSEFRNGLDTKLQRVIDTTRRRQRILALVQEALSQLRLDMKYLLFDLEATRRERDEYRHAQDDHADDDDLF